MSVTVAALGVCPAVFFEPEISFNAIGRHLWDGRPFLRPPGLEGVSGETIVDVVLRVIWVT